MKVLWISVCASLIVTLVHAQRNFNFSKPIVSLEKRPRTPIWQRPPEERRKLSIFPRNNKKFVVTPNTVPKTEEKAAELSIKRSVMRKFVVQDKNEKGAWYFAPRAPLMKTKRFTVTEAPHGLYKVRHNSNSNYEHSSEEENHSKNEQSNKVQINKGTLINTWKNQKINLTASKSLKPDDKVVQKEKLNNYVTNLVPNNYGKKDNSSVNFDSKRGMIKSDVTQINHELEDEKRSIEGIQSPPPLKITEMSTEIVEERSSDFNEMELIDNIENNKNIKTSLNDKTNDSLNLDILEELMKNIMNDTENFSVANNARIKNTTEDEPHELNMEPNNFYEVKSLDNVKGFLDDSIIEFSQVLGGENINALSEIDHSNTKAHLNENSGNSLIMDGFESLIDYIESDLNTDDKSEYIIGGKPQVSIEQNFNKDILEDYTGEPVTITTDVKTSTFEPMIFEPDLNNGLQTESPNEFIFDKVGNPSTEEYIAEINTPDSQNSEEIHESSTDQPITQIFDDLIDEQANISDEVSQEVIIDKLNNVTSDEIPIESLTDRSNNFTGEEVSSEFMIDNENSSNLTTEEISNESNMADEEVSNEFLTGNLSEDTSDELLVYKSNEDISVESTKESENISAEGISIEVLQNRYKRSNNIIEEENQATTITSFKYTGQPTRLSQDLTFKNINA